MQSGVAKSYKVSKDGKTYIFYLRKNAKWSNGDRVTAQDFVYSWRRAVNPKTASSYAYLFDSVKNGKAIRMGKKSGSSLGIKAVGKCKLIVHLTKPVSYFAKMMAFPVFYPQNQQVVQKYGSKYGTASKYMVYNGPFYQTGWTGSNLSWKLKKNSNYWDKNSVKLTTINFSVNKSTTTAYNLYQSGKLDETILSAAQSKSLKGKTGYTTVKSAATYYLTLNFTNKCLKNKYIRKAISLAINRQQFVSKVLSGSSTTARSVVTAGLVSYKGTDFATASYVKEAVSYNIKLAKKYWKLGLKQLGIKKMSLNFLTDDTDTAKSAAEFMQSTLETNLSGLKIHVLSVPFKTRLSRMSSGNFDLVLSGWGADTSDPSSFLDLFTSSNSYNYGKWKNTTYDKLISKAEGTDANNESARWSDYVKAAKLLLKQQAVIPLYDSQSSYMIRTTVKRLIHNMTGADWNFKSTYISK